MFILHVHALCNPCYPMDIGFRAVCFDLILLMVMLPQELGFNSCLVCSEEPKHHHRSSTQPCVRASSSPTTKSSPLKHTTAASADKPSHTYRLSNKTHLRSAAAVTSHGRSVSRCSTTLFAALTIYHEHVVSGWAVLLY